MTKPKEWEQPQWMKDCIDHYWRTGKRVPSFIDFVMWREGDASCRMERDD